MTKEFLKQDLMEKRLKEALSINFLQVENQSAQHKGHAGDDKSGESHYKITIDSPDLKSFKPLQKHRRIFDILGVDIISNTHSISLEVK